MKERNEDEPKRISNEKPAMKNKSIIKRREEKRDSLSNVG